MAGRFYVTGHLGTDSVSERFVALDATVKTGKPSEFRVIRYRKELCARKEVAGALEIEASSELPLSHPNILKLAAAGVWDGACFFAYERLESVSLADAWKSSGRYALEPAIVMSIAAPLLEALIYAHSGHEDPRSVRPRAFQVAFTPENVELTKAGAVKVRGFATAALSQTRRPGPLDQLLGRTGYLSPAILDGGRATPQTDLFSLGILLWELLTGQPLFRKASPEETIAAARTREVPPASSISPLVPAEIESFVTRLLIRDPAFQFRDATEAKAALEKALFSADARADQRTFAAWCQAGVHPAEAKEAKAIVEIVGTRELLKALSAPAAETSAEPGEALVRAPNPAPKPAEPTVTPWEKTRTGVKIVAEEPDSPPPRLAGKAIPKGVLLILATLGALVALAGGAAIFFPDSLSLNGLLGSAVDRVAAALKGEGEAKVLPAAFAYRNQREGSRRVYVQGLRQEAENFFVPCGENGERCRCEFYLAPDDAKPAGAAPANVSRKFNYVYCDLPEGTPAGFVRVVAAGDKPRRTNVLQVVGDLSWQSLLGPALLHRRVRWIQRYECDRTFLEGEGVDAAGGAIVCGAGQHLGIITATFSYHVFRSEEGNGEPGKSVDFKSAVCGITNLTKIRCQEENFVTQAGLYREQAAPFVVPVSLFRAPEGEDPVTVLGYAAGPDLKGNCPVGFANVKLWNAEPASLTEATPDGKTLPTNFTNRIGELSDRVFSPIEPRPFVITRRPNRTPCDGRGDCSLAQFEDARAAATVPYKELATLCVLPPSLLDTPPRETDAPGRILGATAEPVPEAVVEIRTEMPGFDATVNGQKLAATEGRIHVPLHRELKVEISKTGYRTQRLTIPPIESPASLSFDVPAQKVLVGSVDLDAFPRSEVTFWLGDEKVYSGTTPVKETLPAGRYKVKFKTLRTGTESEREVVIQDGKTTVVDHLIHEK